ncbi:MAG: response regulator [Flavobacteriaceae bacterium]
MGKIKIHLVDDHQIVIDGLLAVLKLEADFEVVGFSLNGENVYERLTKNNADILILDINMPNIDGIDILKDFKKKGVSCKIIVLSSYDDIKLIKEVLNLGVSGYLSKKCAGENIAEAIREVYNGKQYFCDSIKDKMLNSFASTDQSTETPVTNITKRELEILQLVVKEFTTKEISEQLTISVNTIDTHRKNIMKKLNVKNTIGLVKYAIKNDLV